MLPNCMLRSIMNVTYNTCHANYTPDDTQNISKFTQRCCQETCILTRKTPVWFPFSDKISRPYISFKITQGTNSLTIIKLYSVTKGFPCPHSILLVTEMLEIDRNKCLIFDTPRSSTNNMFSRAAPNHISPSCEN